MKDSINFYYNLNIGEVENWGNSYRFFYQETLFYFVPYHRTEKELEEIIEISRELKGKNIPIHDILYNKFGNILTKVWNENYILIKPITDTNLEILLEDILKLNNYLVLNTNKTKLYQNLWPTLWAKKIDYFEYQVHELGKNKPLILDTFSYYVGLGENAISYVESTIDKYQISPLDRIVLSHRRILYPNYSLNFYNPLSFIFDLEIRDISEYIKSAFFKSEDAMQILKEVLSKKTFSIYSYQLLYARLLYPTYYFDMYELIMENKEKEEALIPYIEKSSSYETFLKDAYYEIAKYQMIERIEWLLK